MNEKLKHHKLSNKFHYARLPVSDLRKVGCIAFIVLIFSHIAEAKDITTLQAAVSFARKEAGKAKTEYEANMQTVDQQQQIIEQRKKQLANDISSLDIQPPTRQQL